MLDIAFGLIEEATSSSLLMFCFCHLIIVMIFTGSSKPGSMDSQDSKFVTPVSYNMCYISSDAHDDEAMAIAAAVPSAQDEPVDDSSSDEEEDRESSHCYDEDDEDDDDYDYGEDEDNDGDDEDDESKEAEFEDEEGDDDLRKRIEEFIAKINNEWRHEKLRALNFVC